MSSIVAVAACRHIGAARRSNSGEGEEELEDMEGNDPEEQIGNLPNSEPPTGVNLDTDIA